MSPEAQSASWVAIGEMLRIVASLFPVLESWIVCLDGARFSRARRSQLVFRHVGRLGARWVFQKTKRSASYAALIRWTAIRRSSIMTSKYTQRIAAAAVAASLALSLVACGGGNAKSEASTTTAIESVAVVSESGATSQQASVQ